MESEKIWCPGPGLLILRSCPSTERSGATTLALDLIQLIQSRISIGAIGRHKTDVLNYERITTVWDWSRYIRVCFTVDTPVRPCLKQTH